MSRMLRGAARLLVAFALAAVATSCGRPSGGAAGEAGQALVGAYYYVWWDAAEWRKGYLGERLTPPVRPLLGEYSSADPRVAAQHVAWASEYGIDFFVVSWPGRSSRADRHLESGLLAAPNLGDVRFALLYESLLALGHQDHRVAFDEPTTARFVGDLEHLARRYFNHPRYLRLDGRPVLFLYVTRNFEGKHREALAAARRALERLGPAPYLVGDEVFWHDPRRRRLRLFEAVTAYNMYDWPRGEFAGYAGGSRFLPEVTAQYRRYRKATTDAGVAFVPSVLPGYNDRGVRPDANHYVIPRRLGPEGAEGGLLAEGLRQTGLPFLGNRNRLLVITSFNEWHEWTQVEPTTAGPPTVGDASGAGRYTAGLVHQGYGLRSLEVLRDVVVALGGRVTAPGGGLTEAAGVEVQASAGGRVVATTRTDSAGRFRFGRAALPPGEYELAVGPRGERRRVVVGPTRAASIELE
jgi:glycoprotein endo-alpha-1,2-mannosidase